MTLTYIFEVNIIWHLLHTMNNTTQVTSNAAGYVHWNIYDSHR